MLEWLLLPLNRLGMKGQSNRQTDRFELQGSNNFWLPPREGWLLKKMIKEDHLLACTTKMFEILVALPHQLRANPNPAELRLGSSGPLKYT